MTSLAELKKQRINKIKSLTSDEVKNYVDVLVKDLSDLYYFDNVTADSYDEITDIYDKLTEIGDLTYTNYNNIKSYIKSEINEKLTIIECIRMQKAIVKDANAKNIILSQLLKQIIIIYGDFNMYVVLLYSLVSDFNELSDIAPDVVNKKILYVDSLEKVILELKLLIEKDIAIIDGAFYSDETIINGIHDLKITIKELTESSDEFDKLCVEFGIVDVLIDLIKAYETHAEIKELYMQYKPDIVDLLESADNVFVKYDASGGIVFNANTGELIE